MKLKRRDKKIKEQKSFSEINLHKIKIIKKRNKRKTQFMVPIILSILLICVIFGVKVLPIGLRMVNSIRQENGDSNLKEEIKAKNTIATVGDSLSFDYTGDIQEFEVTVSGEYQLEVWGAQGGYDISAGTKYYGGYGGYSKGNITLQEGEKLYIAVGGKGADCDYTIRMWMYDSPPLTTHSSSIKLTPEQCQPSGGWNGGGAPWYKSDEKVKDDPDDPDDDGYWAYYLYEGGGGGGATSIQKTLIGDGQLKNYESNKENVLIVAGGGGGGATSPGSDEDNGYYSSDVEGSPGGGLERRRIFWKVEKSRYRLCL